jgi:hypothetical protein
MAWLASRAGLARRLAPPGLVRMAVREVAGPGGSVTQVKGRKRQLVVNSKWEEKSGDPLYSHLLYSSEVDVVLTARRGKAWMEMQAAEQWRADNDRKFRERNAQSSPTPLALGLLWDGARRVQGEGDVTEDREILVQDSSPPELEEGGGRLEAGGEPRVKESFPYNVFTDMQSIRQADLDNKPQPPPVARVETRRGRGRGARGRPAAPPEPSVENPTVQHDVIPDSLNLAGVRELFSEDHLFKHGTPDPSEPGSRVPCGGCGALLHCREERIPGYLPSQLLSGRGDQELRAQLCQRCYIIQEYNVALAVNVSPEDYPRAIEHIRDREALVLLVVDLLDFPGSVWPGILSLLGTHKKVIVVGNKLDLIVPDGRIYRKRITNIIRREFLKKCWDDADGEGATGAFPQVVGSCCVSATTGLNIETLIEMIFDNWKTSNNTMPGDIYIVGCTNVGKSSLFNSLLDSDLCRVRALERVQKAVVSPVPGTTLNLLQFPLSRPEPHFLAVRRKRIQHADREWWRAEDARREELAASPGLRYALPSHYAIKHTLLASDAGAVESSYMNTVDTARVEGVGRPDRLNPAEPEFLQGKHCHDSPGTVSRDQIINLLTTEEISRTLASTPLHPRTFLLKLHQTVLLGGLGRLDYIEGPEERATHPLLVTVFCSALLPVTLLPTTGVEQFLAAAAGGRLVAVPGAVRPEPLPALLGRRLEVEGAPRAGQDLYSGAADIVLSSAGWVMVSSREGERNVFVAYTPGGRGAVAREPFLPYSVGLRGRRVQGTPKFRNDNFGRSMAD